MPTVSLNISAIPAFSDNYIWMIDNGGKSCAVIDPGEAEPVLDILQQKGLELTHILLTHHHHDHIGGVKELLEHYDANVFGPADDRIPFQQQVCHEGDMVDLAGLDVQFSVLEVPAHTRSHIAFVADSILFCGDTLFSLGCGRFFEGTATDMQKSLDKLAALPAGTQVYCAHEYTQANCAFALAVEPNNNALQTRSREIEQLRAIGKPTVPSRLGDELDANPFLRTRVDSVVQAARKIDPQATAGASTMAVIRAWKDRF